MGKEGARGPRGIMPTHEEIRARRKPDRIVPTQCGTVLSQAVYEPTRDRAYEMMLSRIDANKQFIVGKK